MNRITGKIHDTKGVTMIMAMLLVMAATMVSCAVLAAAATAAKHIQNDRVHQQTYLTVGSAAELVRDTLCGETYSIEVKEVKPAVGTSEKTTTVTADNGAFASVINPAIESALGGEPYSVSFTLNADTLQTVTAQFSMDAERNIRILFSIDEATGYKMELTLAPVCHVDTVKSSEGTGERKTVTTVVTTTYSWEARDIVKVGAEGA